MENLVKSDVFFFISSVATILIAVILVIVLVYVIKILRDIKEVSSKIRQESDAIIDDVTVLRNNIKKEGTRARDLLGAAVRMFDLKRIVKKKKVNSSKTSH